MAENVPYKKEVFLNVTIETVGESLAYARAMLDNDLNYHKAVNLALKRALESARTAGARSVVKKYHITYGNFLENTVIINSHHTKAGFHTIVRAGYKGHAIPLIEFNTGVSADGRPTAAVYRKSTKKELNNVFYASVKGYREDLYERVGEHRFPIKGKYGPSTAVMLANEEITAEMDKAAADTYMKRLEHEITEGWKHYR